QHTLEANRQLQNQDDYRQLDAPIYPQTAVKIQYNPCWTRNKSRDSDIPKPRKFYLLPKRHKNPQIWDCPIQNPTQRPQTATELLIPTSSESLFPASTAAT
ncbi:hypothetical protein GN956_G7229, partial [Arapaima gigas]